MQDQEQKEVEVDLRDYINVVLKRKRTILTVFLVLVILTAIVSYLRPKIYRVSMIIEPANFGRTAGGGGTVYLDSVGNMKPVIENEVFNVKIIERLNLDVGRELKFVTSQLNGSQLLRVSIEQREEEIEEGKRILNQLFDELSDTYHTGSLKNKEIEQEISAALISIRGKENEIKLQEQTLTILKQRESGLTNEIKEAGSGKNKWSGKKDVLLFSYYNQLMISYIDQLNQQLFNLKLEKERAETSIKNLQNEIEKLQINVEKLKIRKGEIRNMRLLMEPAVSLSPIKPEKRQDVTIAGVLGLMLGIFAAFFQEYWEKSKSISSKDKAKVD